MKTVNDILQYLDTLAPMSLKMDFDNVGLLVGDGKNSVYRCLISLDITDEVIDEAVEYGAQLIVSHHPVIFGAIKRIVKDDLIGRKLIKLIKNDISAVCMHTNLDIAEGGVNDILINTLGAVPEGILEPCGEDHGCGRVGELPGDLRLDEFLPICKEKLKSNGLRYFDAGLPVRRLSVMGGSGGDCVEIAKKLGCDTYVTSDIKYNAFLDAKELGINLIDADHFCTENVVTEYLYAMLSDKYPEVEFCISAVHAQTAKFF